MKAFAKKNSTPLELIKNWFIWIDVVKEYGSTQIEYKNLMIEIKKLIKDNKKINNNFMLNKPKIEETKNISLDKLVEKDLSKSKRKHSKFSAMDFIKSLDENSSENDSKKIIDDKEVKIVDAEGDSNEELDGNSNEEVDAEGDSDEELDGDSEEEVDAEGDSEEEVDAEGDSDEEVDAEGDVMKRLMQKTTVMKRLM